MNEPGTPSEPREALASPNAYEPTPSDKLFPTWERMLRFAWVAGVAVVAVLGYRFWKPKAAEPVVPALYFSKATQWSSDSGLTLAPAISPNGNLVAFASDREGSGSLAIWTRPFDSGSPTRLTSGEFNESDPDFSPDGRQIVFRSERDGGGVYTIPAAGGAPPRLAAKRGWRPKFSPDGKWIAYFTLEGSEDLSATFGVGQIFIVPSEGGEPRRIQPAFPYARYPVWAPDSQHLLFSGTSQDGMRDWWLAPLDGAPAARTHAIEWLNRSLKSAGHPEQWRDGVIYFSGAEEVATHLWALPISASSMRVTGAPRRLTDGANQEQQSAAGPGGRLLYSALRFSSDIWSLPIDANGAQVRGKLKAVTTDGLRAQLPSLSPDGSKMIYISNKSGVRDVRVSDSSGKGDEAVTSFRQIGYRPLLSPDGKAIVYPATVGGKCVVALQSLTGRDRPAQLEGCFNIWDWSPDGSSLLTFQSTQPTTVEVRRIATGERHVALSHPTQGLFGARFSPDGRWIAFTAGPTTAQARVFIAPYRSSPPLEREWIMAAPELGGGEPAWSPDGNVLYFHSKRDGYHCIWAQRLRPDKTPAGEPVAIQHLHASGFGMFFMRAAEFGLSVTGDQLAMNLSKGTGNIWTTTVEKK